MSWKRSFVIRVGSNVRLLTGLGYAVAEFDGPDFEMLLEEVVRELLVARGDRKIGFREQHIEVDSARTRTGVRRVYDRGHAARHDRDLVGSGEIG